LSIQVLDRPNCFYRNKDSTLKPLLFLGILVFENFESPIIALKDCVFPFTGYQKSIRDLPRNGFTKTAKVKCRSKGDSLINKPLQYFFQVRETNMLIAKLVSAFRGNKKLFVLPVAFLLVFAYQFPGLTLAGSISTGSYPSPQTPIDHIVFIIQENQVFDHYFGAFPNLRAGYGLNYSVCERYNITDPKSKCVHPWNADSKSIIVQATDLNHGRDASWMSFDNGSMDGFVQAQYEMGPKQYANYTMSYYTNYTLPNYWDLASYYTLDANFFSSVMSYTYPNHLYMVAAQGGQDQRVSLNLTYPTIVNQMNKAGIDWKYYSDDWNVTNDCHKLKTWHMVNFWPYRNVLPDFPAVQLNSQTCWRIQNLGDLYNDIANGSLPQVSWVTPNQNGSEHPGSSGPFGLIVGQEYTASIIDDIESNPNLWKSTAIFLCWDDFGGEYDNVPPVQVDQYGYSFRVPMIIISPYASSGIYYGQNYQQEDFSAFLSTIEANWNLQNLTNRDGKDASLLLALNFNQQPRQPLLMPLVGLAVYPWETCVSRGICSLGSSNPLDLHPGPGAPGINQTYTVIPGDDTSD
jgi:phospholipase C